MTEKFIKPMPLWLSLIFFGIPGFIIYMLVYYGVPYLLNIGMPLVYAMPLLLTLPGILLIPVSLILYSVDNKKYHYNSFKERFRLYKIKGKEWLLVLLVFVLCLAADELLQPVGKWLAGIQFFSPPGYIDKVSAPLNPFKEFSFPITEFMGTTIKGNWLILLVWIPLNLMSMIGEELLWRGYILPRQEKRHKKYAFIINSLLWEFFIHACMKWNYIGMIPSMVLTPWIAQKLQNTTASMFVHIVGNILLFFLFILIGVLGIGT